MRDPDEGRHASGDVASSWGQLKIYVDGKNLCEARDSSGTLLDGVLWYLVPALAFFVRNWEPLLHQGRLPVRSRTGLSSATQMAHTEVPSGARELGAFLSWHDNWSHFYVRHALCAGREGGIFPNVWFRRILDDVEISWDNDSNPAELPIRFLERRGEGLVSAREFADVLGGILAARLDELGRRAERAEVEGLKRELEAIRQPRTERRWLRHALLLDLRRNIEEAVELAKRLAQRMPIAGPDQHEGDVAPATLPSVVFSSFSPDISEQDALVMLAAFEHARVGAERAPLEELHEALPCPYQEPWRSGYELALRLREQLGLGDDPVNAEGVVRDLGIAIQPVTLSDPDVRAVSAVDTSQGVAPTILINETSPWFAKASARAVTLTHELSHLAFDRRIGTAVGIASGPWAPVRFEQRANAFAVMFLLPEAGVTDVFGQTRGDLEACIARVAQHFGASFLATVEHLTHLGLFERAERDALVDEIVGTMG